jgi:alpha-beta hydrolase superfamily lysophospholipase
LAVGLSAHGEFKVAFTIALVPALAGMWFGQVPVLIMHSDDDQVVPIADSALLSAFRRSP